MLNNEDEATLEEFRKKIYESLISQPKMNKEQVKQVLLKQVEDFFPAPKPPECWVMWDRMSLFDKALWFLFRVWPFKRIAEKHRSLIDRINHEITIDQPSIHYKPIYHPHPKQVIQFSIRVQLYPSIFKADISKDLFI